MLEQQCCGPSLCYEQRPVRVEFTAHITNSLGLLKFPIHHAGQVEGWPERLDYGDCSSMGETGGISVPPGVGLGSAGQRRMRGWMSKGMVDTVTSPGWNLWPRTSSSGVVIGERATRPQLSEGSLEGGVKAAV